MKLVKFLLLVLTAVCFIVAVALLPEIPSSYENSCYLFISTFYFLWVYLFINEADE